MSVDYVMLWVLAVTNTLGLLVVVRQLAFLPKYSVAPGPRVGRLLPAWTFTTLDGQQRALAELPTEYVAIFAAEGCGPCHTLFARLAHEGRPPARLVVLAEGNAARLVEVAQTPAGPLYDEFLAGLTRAMMLELDVPSTPYAIAVRHGHVIAAGPARTRAELAGIGDTLRVSDQGRSPQSDG